MDSLFQDLPLLEQLSISIHLSLLVLYLLFVSTRWIFSSIDRVQIVKEDRSNANSNSIQRGGCEDSIQNIEIGTAFKVTVFCCFYVLFLQVLVLGCDVATLIREKVSKDWSILFLPIAESLAWFVLSFSAFNCKFNVLEKFPLLVRIWWLVSFIICLSGLYFNGKGLFIDAPEPLTVHVVANFAATPAIAFLCFVAIRGVTGIQMYRNSDIQEPLLQEEEAGCLKVTPYNGAGIFCLATLSWLNPLLSTGAKRPLELRDIPLLAPKDRSKTSYKVLNSNWEKLKAENPSKQPSLAWAIFKSFRKEAAWNAVFAGLTTLVSYVGPYMVSYFVDYLGGIVTFPNEGYVLAGIFFVSKLVETMSTRQWYLGVDILGMHVRGALTAMVYRKGLRLSSTARQSHTIGEIVNYMAVECKESVITRGISMIFGCFLFK